MNNVLNLNVSEVFLDNLFRVHAVTTEDGTQYDVFKACMRKAADQERSLKTAYKFEYQSETSGTLYTYYNNNTVLIDLTSDSEYNDLAVNLKKLDQIVQEKKDIYAPVINYVANCYWTNPYSPTNGEYFFAFTHKILIFFDKIW